MKYLIWIVIAWAVVVWLQRAKKNLIQRARQAAENAQAGSGATATAAGASATPKQAIEQMVQCAHCGIYVPASEAVSGASGALFCCKEHRTAAEFGL